MINVQAIPAFEDNYIWLLRQNGSDKVVLVDPGDAGPVLDTLSRQQWQAVAILITHHHGDHTGGIKALAGAFSLPVYGPANENISGVTDTVAEGDVIDIPAAGLTFRVFDVPGHTRGHVAYYGHDALFCGDALFTCGCGRLFEGSAEQLYQSLDKFSALPGHTQVYCAHEYTADNIRFALVVEPDNADLQARQRETRDRRRQGQATVPASLDLERRTNPFLRCREDTVIRAAEGFARRPLDGAAEVFAVVRHWKDTLD